MNEYIRILGFNLFSILLTFVLFLTIYELINVPYVYSLVTIIVYPLTAQYIRDGLLWLDSQEPLKEV